MRSFFSCLSVELQILKGKFSLRSQVSPKCSSLFARYMYNKIHIVNSISAISFFFFQGAVSSQWKPILNKSSLISIHLFSTACSGTGRGSSSLSRDMELYLCYYFEQAIIYSEHTILQFYHVKMYFACSLLFN